MRRLRAQLVDDVRRLGAGTLAAPALLVVPSRLLGDRLRADLAAALGAVAAVHVVTLPELAERIAAIPLALRGRRPLPAVADRFLVERAVGEAVPATGGYFTAVAGCRNFPPAVLRTLLDLKRAGVSPAQLEAAFPDSEKVRELAACQRAVERALRDQGYHDASDLLAEAARLLAAEPQALGASAVFVFGFVELNPLETRLLEACGGAAPLRTYPAAADAAELPAPDAIEIVAAPGEEREAREIARLVLRHVETGGRFEDVGILLRQPSAYRAPLRDVFEAAGIPYAFGAAPAIAETRAGRTLRLLAEAHRSDFARAAVVELFALADLRPRPGTSPAEWERLSRLAGIVGGAREWRDRLDRLAGRLEGTAARATEADADDRGSAERARDRDALAALRRAVRILLRGVGRLADPGPLGAMVDGITRTVRRLVAESVEMEHALGVLARLRELGPETPIGRDELWRLVEAALGAPLDQPTGPVPGRVFVGELASALGLDFPLTILPGLVEGGFPASVRQDPILLDAERRRLPGLPLAETARALDRTRFWLAVGSGARRVVLTYPRVDAESGRPRVPSFLLLELLEAVTGRRHDFEALERFPGWRSVPLHPAPPGARERPVDEREWLIARALEARAAPEALLRTLPGAARGLAAIRAREGTDALTAYDGLVGRAAELGGIPLAPTALETYVTCPFRYLLERVFALRPVEEPDRVLLIQALDRGELVHAVLEETFRELAEAGELPLTRARLPAARAALERAFDGQCAAAERRGVTGLPALWAGARARLRAELLAAIEAEAEDPEPWLPVRFEAAFGLRWREGSAPPLAYPLPDGSAVHLAGSMDRLDRSPDGQRARVIDYKTGRVRIPRSADRLAGGRALQLPVYRLAAEAWFEAAGFPAAVDEAQYYHVIGPDAGARIRFTRQGWAARRADFDRILTAVADGVRAGRFFQRPAGCARGPCAFDLACGAERRRWAESKRADPAVAAHDALDAIP